MGKVKISYNHWTIQPIEKHNRRRRCLSAYYKYRENTIRKRQEVANTHLRYCFKCKFWKVNVATEPCLSCEDFSNYELKEKYSKKAK